MKRRVGALLMAAVLAMSSIAPLAEEELGTEAVPVEAVTEVTTEADEGAYFEVSVPEDNAGETLSEEVQETYEYVEEPAQVEETVPASEEPAEETPAEESEEPEETGEETEPWDGFFTNEHPEWGGILTASIPGADGRTIKLEIPSGAFSEAVTLDVKAEIYAPEAAYERAELGSVMDAEMKNFEDDIVYNFYVLTLTFYNDYGVAVQPNGSISVTADMSASPVGLGANDGHADLIEKYFYRSSDSYTEKLWATISTDSANSLTGLTFVADSLSTPFVFMMTEPAPQEEETETDTESETESETETETETEEETEKIYTAGDGGIIVTVTAPAGALPKDADLQVVMYGGNSNEYAEAAEAIGLDPEEAAEIAAIEDEDGIRALAGFGTPNVEGTGLAVVDISFVENGEEIEPSEPVDVKIDASAVVPAWADATSVEIQHLEEDGDAVTPVVVASGSTVAEFEVESFSSFTVTWEAASGGGQGNTYTVTVTAFLDEKEIEGIANQTFTSEDDELDFVTLLSEVGYGSGDYTFQYATANVNGTNYGGESNSLVAIELERSGQTQQFELVFRDGSVETFTASTATISVDAYYTTPDFSVSIEALGMDETSEEWILQAVLSHTGDYVSANYEWTVDSDKAYVRFTDNTGEAFIAWADGVEDNTEVTVTVTVTLTYEDETTETATADYVLEFNDETVDLYMTYGPNKDTLPAGIEVTVSNESHSYTGTTDSDGIVHDLDIVPGIYTVTATYTDDDGNTYQCSESVAMHDTGNYYVNLNYYNEAILTTIPERDNWEHVDVKLSFGTTSSSAGNYSAKIIGAQIIGSNGTVKYTATEASIEGNDNEFQLTFYDGEATSGTPSHSISFSTGDYIVLNYYLYLDGVQQGDVYTIIIYTDSVYADGTTYPADGERAYKLYNYLYGTSYVSDAQLQEAGITEIDISGMSMMLVAAILCDSSEVTGAGEVQAASSQSANQWGMDFALSIETMAELSANWQFSVTKTYENASMRAGDFTFNLYASDAGFSERSLLMTLTNATSGIGSDGNSYDTMNSFPISYDDADIEAKATYYYILEEVQDTVTSGTEGVVITFDKTVYYITVQLGVDEGTGEATVTATYTTDTTEEGDSRSADSFSFVNTYQGYTEISGSKTWVDNGNEYNTRPQSITITLLQDDEEYDSKVVTENDNWSWSFTELPLFSGTTEHEYSIGEVTVEGYTTTVNGNDLINTLTGTTEITVSKVWVDNEGAYNTRPDSITVTITGSDSNSYTLELSDSNNWSATKDELPMYDSTGAAITYEVSEEDISGYEGDIKDNGDGTYTITNTLTGTTEISVDKTWVGDSDDKYGTRPDSITVTITGNNETYSLELNENNGWSATESDLPKYDSTGTEISYAVSEGTVNGYMGEVKNNGDGTYSITNTLETIDINGTKTWDDANNQDGKRPTSITIHLFANDEEIDSINVEGDSKAETWDWSFIGLPRVDSDGNEITYTVAEDTIEDYTTEIDSSDGYNITNSYKPGKVSLNVQKVWIDDEDADGERPTSITVILLKNGDETDDKLILDESNGWSGTFDDLDEYTDGEKNVYSVDEVEVDDYTTVISSSETEGTTTILITNTHTSQLIEISGTKVWEDNDDAAGIRPESITVNLYRKGIDGGEDVLVDTKEVTEADDWSWTFEDLPEYHDHGVAYEYYVTEESIEGYETEITGDAESGFTITNTANYQDLSISKEVSGDGDATEYEFEIKLTLDGEPFEGEIFTDGGDKLSFAGGTATITVEAGETVTLEILDGMEWEITEVSNDADSVLIYVDGTVVERPADKSQAYAAVGTIHDTTEVEFVNSYREYFPIDEEIIVDPDGDIFDDGNRTKEEAVNEYNAIEIEMTTNLPVITGYDLENGSFTLNFHEVLDSNLVLDEADADFSVYIAGYKIDHSYYTVTIDPDDGCSFHVDVDLTALYGDGEVTDDMLDGSTEITVFFFADLEGTGLNGTYTSTIWYEVADDGEILYTSNVDVVNVYTYDVKILKYDESVLNGDNYEGAALAGATLGIYYDEDCSEPVSRNDAPYTEVSGEDGYVDFYGLADGTYYVSEVSAPSGYVISNEVLPVEIGSDLADYTYEGTFANTPKDQPVKGVDTNEDQIYDNDGATVKVGQTVEYEISYTNTGDAEETVIFTDTLTDELDYVSASDDGSYDEASRTITWPEIEIAAGETLSVTFKATINEGAANVDVVENTAEMVYADNPDVKVQTNTVENPVEPEEPTPQNPKKDVDVGDGTKVSVGENLTYTISFYNHYDEAVEVTVTDGLDAGLTFVSASDDGTYNESTRTITWTIVTDAESYGEVSFVATVNENAGSQVENDADVQIWNDAVVTTNKVENPLEEEETPAEPGTPKDPTKAVDIGNGTTAAVGQELTYTITYYNHYAETVDVTISDLLDTGLEFVSASNGGTYDATTRTVSWTIKDAAPVADGSVTLTVKVTEDALMTGSVENVATVRIGNDDAVGTNLVSNPVVEEGTDSVKTGDTTPFGPIAAIMAMALALLTGTVVYRRRRTAR